MNTMQWDTLPEAIRLSRRAVVWTFEQRNGKRTKVPRIADDPSRCAAVDDPSTWRPFSVAHDTVLDGKAAGAGVVLGEGRVGVDLDHCRTPETGAIAAWAWRIIRALDSYTEVSPSGTGVHVLLRGTLPPGRRRKGRVEMYCDGRYFTVTGEHVAGTPTTINERSAQLAAVHAQTFDEPVDAKSHTVPCGIFDDVALLEKARTAANGAKFIALEGGDEAGYTSRSEADLAFCCLLAFWTDIDPARMDRLFRQSGRMRKKWDTRRGTSTYGEQTIAKAIAGCHETYHPGVNGYRQEEPCNSEALDVEADPTPAPPAPEPFETVTVPESFVTKFIDYVAMRCDAPPEAAELFAVGQLSALAGPHVRIPLAMHDDDLRPVLWTMFIVDSTTGRKTTVLKFARTILQEVLGKQALLEWEGSPQGFVQRLQDRDGQSAVFLRDEYSGLLAMMNRGGHVTGLEQTFIRTYDGQVIENIRVRKKQKKTGEWQDDTDRVEQPYLTKLTGTTWTNFVTRSTIDNVLDGFLARFIFVSAHATPQPPRLTSQAMLDARADLIEQARKFHERARQGVRLDVAEDVLERWWELEVAWSERAAQSRRAEAAGPMFKRLSEAVLKVAALLALEEEDRYPPTVERKHFDAAAAMGERWVNCAERVIAALGATTFQRDCDAVAATIPPVGALRSAVYQANRRLRKKDFDEVLQALETQERIVTIRLPTPARGGHAQLFYKRGPNY